MFLNLDKAKAAKKVWKRCDHCRGVFKLHRAAKNCPNCSGSLETVYRRYNDPGKEEQP